MMSLYATVLAPFNTKQEGCKQDAKKNNPSLQLFGYFLYPVTEELSWKLIMNSTNTLSPMNPPQESIPLCGTL